MKFLEDIPNNVRYVSRCYLPNRAFPIFPPKLDTSKIKQVYILMGSIRTSRHMSSWLFLLPTG